MQLPLAVATRNAAVVTCKGTCSSHTDAAHAQCVWHVCVCVFCIGVQMSVKCYALVPCEELARPGAAMLHLHKKPVDYKHRSQRPSYSSKPMYLHIMRTLTEH